MDRNLSIDLEAQFHRPAVDVEHRNFEQALEAAGAAHDHRFLVFPGQYQHVKTSMLAERHKKKPTWSNTFRHSTTSAYSATSRPARPGCSSSSLPTTIRITIGANLPDFRS